MVVVMLEWTSITDSSLCITGGGIMTRSMTFVAFDMSWNTFGPLICGNDGRRS